MDITAVEIVEELNPCGTVRGCLVNVNLQDLTEIVILGRGPKGSYISSTEDDPSELLEEAIQSLPFLLEQKTSSGPGL